MLEVQRLASTVVDRVSGGRSLDAALAAVKQRYPQLTDAERAAVQDLAYGSLRFRGRLDALIDVLVDRPLRDSRLRALLQVALYQLDHTRAAPHAIVDHAVRCAGRLGLTSARGLVNAVLRRFLRQRADLETRTQHAESARYSHPQWWVDRLRVQYPLRFAEILRASNSHPPLTLRINRRRVGRAEYLRLLADQGIAAGTVGEAGILCTTPLPANRIPGLADGLVSVQDAGAQLAAPLLDVADGQRVLDACAAPGGKTTHVLELADCELTGLDNDEERLTRVRANLDRLGFAARLVCGDAGEPANWWDGRLYDRILADVPCSASGVVRRHPDIKWLRRESDIGQFAALQQRMLTALWRLLNTGGKLLYATCSVFQEENCRQVEWFVQNHPDAQRLSLAEVVQEAGAPAGQLLPNSQHDGFFYALLQKR